MNDSDNDLTVSLGDFLLWKEDKVTQTVFKYLEHCLEMNKERRLSPTYVQDPNGLLKLNYFLGYEDAISELLNVKETIIEEDHE